MKRYPSLIVAASLAAGAFGLSANPSFAQERTPEERAQRQAERQQQAEQQRQDREGRRAERQARKGEKGEQEQLQNMPKPVRDALTAQVGQGTAPNYYKVADGDQRTFGVVFKDAAGETVDVRVDREGKVLSRLSSGDAAAAAQQPAPTPAQPVPTPAPAAGTPAPAAGTPAATAQIQPGQGVGLEQIPAQPQAVLREQVKGAHDIRFFRAMFNNQEVWEAKFTTADGRDMAVRVDDAGRIVGNSKPLEAEERGSDGRERREVKFDSMPQNIKDQFRKEKSERREGAQFYRNTWNGKQVYESMYWENDQRWVVRLDESGKEIDRSVLKDAKRVSDYDKKKDDDKKKDKDKDDRK